jgi:hypothetical protein
MALRTTNLSKAIAVPAGHVLQYTSSWYVPPELESCVSRLICFRLVTPWNRANVQETGNYLGLLHNLSRGPIIRSYDSLPPRFMEQIRQKITKQSERYRGGFKALGYHVDSDDTVRMLFEHKPVESVSSCPPSDRNMWLTSQT